MTDPIDTARQEGIALGLATAAQTAAWFSDQDYCAMGYPEDAGIAASGTAHNIEQDILALTPIPPHVAAARVFLDMPPNRDGLHVLPDHMRAALEQIAKEEW